MRTILLTAGLALSCLMAYLGWSLQQTTLDHPTLPAPGPQVTTSSDHLQTVLATALQHQGNPHVTMTTTIPHIDQQPFQDHLFNIAPQKGWYAHLPSNQTIHVVLPRDDIPELEQLVQDPTGWTLRHLAHPKPSRGPANTDLVNVHLRVVPTLTDGLYTVLGVLTWMLALLTGAVTFAFAIHPYLLRIRAKPRSKHSA